MPPRAIFPLQFRAVCDICRGTMEPGTVARRAPGPTFPRRYYCMRCAPVTKLAPGTAEGAADSSKAHLKASTPRGRALRTGVPTTPSKTPGKRKRPSGNQRLARAMRAKPSE